LKNARAGFISVLACLHKNNTFATNALNTSLFSFDNLEIQFNQVLCSKGSFEMDDISGSLFTILSK
jgi:hypothetical protein